MKKEVVIRFDIIRFIERVFFIMLVVYVYNNYISTKTLLSEKINLEETLKDSLISYRNKNNEMVSTIKSFETSEVKTFLDLKTKNEKVKNLQKEVSFYRKYLKKVGGSVTNISSETKIDTVFHSTNIKDSINPMYETKFNLNDWVFGKALQKKDSLELDLKIRNDYTVVLGRDKNGDFAKVINKNPYSITKSLKTYKVSLKPVKKFLPVIYGGVGISSDFKPQIQIGVGIGFNPFRK